MGYLCGLDFFAAEGDKSQSDPEGGRVRGTMRWILSVQLQRMVHEGLLGPWGPIVLIIIGAVVFVIALLLIACFLMPGCIGYECVRKRKQKVNSVLPRFKGSADDNLKMNDVSYRSWRLGSLYENGSNGTITESVEVQGNARNFNNNGHSFGMDTSSTMTLIQADKQKNEKKLKDFPTELTMSLQYLPPCDDTVTGKFVIGIEAVYSLPPKQYNGTLEPYVALDIVKQSWSNRKRIKLHSFKTRGIRHTASPIYKETFVVADVKPHEVREWILDIAAFDHDKYANHTELCSLKVALKDVKKIFQSPEIHLFNYRMKQSNQEFGNILLGISYLPTAQRLSVNVIRVRDIKFTKFISNLEEFNPYVRILMLNAKTGKKLKRRKTRCMHAVAQPEFNETVTFDLMYNQLDNVQFLVVLCSKVLPECAEICAKRGTNWDISDSDDSSIHSYKKYEDIFIGKVAFGKGVRGSTERLHWFSVLQNPRKLVTVWHTLK